MKDAQEDLAIKTHTHGHITLSSGYEILLKELRLVKCKSWRGWKTMKIKISWQQNLKGTNMAVSIGDTVISIGKCENMCFTRRFSNWW